MRHCVEVGGALTGEHGIGMEKNELMPLIFTPDDLALMERVRAAFNPVGRLNPGKVLPMGKACGEIRVPPTAGLRGDSRMSRSAQASFHALEEIVGGAQIIADGPDSPRAKCAACAPQSSSSRRKPPRLRIFFALPPRERLAVIPTGGCTKLAIGAACAI